MTFSFSPYITVVKEILCWLRTNPDAREVNQKNHGLCIKVRFIKLRGYKLVKVISLFQWQELSFVYLFQAVKLRLCIILSLEERHCGYFLF